MSEPALSAYAQRMSKTCDYIDQHLYESLSVEQLCRVANFSKTHFHRQFCAYTGVTVYKYIQLLRLKRASYELVFNAQKKIIDIAFEANFENPESFSRAFKKAFAQTPSQFRKAPKWQAWSAHYQFSRQESVNNMPVNIQQFPGANLAVLQHRGSPDLLNHSVGQFIEWRQNSSLCLVEQCATYGIAYDDPETTPKEDFRFDIGTLIQNGEADDKGQKQGKTVPANQQGVINGVIPAGRSAQLRHVGSHELLVEKARYLYADWLPNSGEELRDFPCFFHYINFYPDVAEHELITDIYLLLK